METKEFTFLSSDNQTTIHAVKWIPANGKFSKILQISHGMIEYIERYKPFAEYLTSKDYLVVGHDHLGHGKSVISNDNLGYFGDNPSQLVIEDMNKLRTIIQEEYKDLPYYMLGHSMGSFMLRKYLSFYSKGLSGAIIMGTGYTSLFVVNMGLALIKTIACFRGWKYRSETLEHIGLGGGPYKKYDLTGQDTTRSWLTKDENIVKKYYSDPLCTFKFTLNGYLGLLDAIYFGGVASNVDKIDKNVPILIVSGVEDPVGGEKAEGVKIVYNMMKNSGINDVTMKLYENDRHEILNELDKEKVFADIEEWMNNKYNIDLKKNI